MYKKTRPVENFGVRIKQLVSDLNLTAPKLNEFIKSYEQAETLDKWIPHALNLECHDKNKSKRFLRVILWDDQNLHKIREAGIKAQAYVEQLIQDQNYNFCVPEIISSSLKNPDSGLVWDLSEYIEGTHFPFDMEVKNQLDEMTEHCKIFIEVMDILTELPDGTLPDDDKNKFLKHSELYFQWAFQTKLIENSLLTYLCSTRDKYFKNTNSNELALCHPDFHTGNAIYTRDHQLCVIDWDNTKIADKVLMYARHWIIMSHESKWQRSFLEQLRTHQKNNNFWERFLVHAAYRGLDQCHFELERKEEKFSSLEELRNVYPARAGVAERMSKAITSLFETMTRDGWI